MLAMLAILIVIAALGIRKIIVHCWLLGYQHQWSEWERIDTTEWSWFPSGLKALARYCTRCGKIQGDIRR